MLKCEINVHLPNYSTILILEKTWSPEVKPVSVPTGSQKAASLFESPERRLERTCVWTLPQRPSPRWEALRGTRRAYGDMAGIRCALICQNGDLRHRRPQPRPPGGEGGGVNGCGRGYISEERVSISSVAFPNTCVVSSDIKRHFRRIKPEKNLIFVFAIDNLDLVFMFCLF